MKTRVLTFKKGWVTEQFKCNTCKHWANYESANPMMGVGSQDNNVKAISDGWLDSKDQGEWKWYCPSCNDDAPPEKRKEFKIKAAFQKINPQSV